MKKFSIAGIIATVALSALPMAAAVVHDTDVTNNFINGTDVSNGGFTVDRAGGVEVGLRARTRYPDPLNDFPNNGAGTFGDFPNGGYGVGVLNQKASWAIDFSINSNYDGTSGFNLNGLTYVLEFDTDPSAGVLYSFNGDPINQPYADHAIGTNATPQGGGTIAADSLAYMLLIGGNNLAQNTVRYDFLFGPGTFDPNAEGTYNVRLSAYNGVDLVAQSSIDVVVTPEPGTFAMLGLGVAGLAWMRRRRA